MIRKSMIDLTITLLYMVGSLSFLAGTSIATVVKVMEIRGQIEATKIPTTIPGGCPRPHPVGDKKDND